MTVREVRRRSFHATTTTTSAAGSGASAMISFTRREMMLIRVTVRVVIGFCISWLPYAVLAILGISGIVSC